VLGDSNQAGKDLGGEASWAAGTLAYFQGDLDEADRLYGQAFQAQDDAPSERSATILIGLGNVASDRFDLAAARASYERALDIARQCGALGRQSAALANLGLCALEEHNLPAARSLIEQAISIYDLTGDRKSAAIGLTNLARVAMEEGRMDDAPSLLRSALTVFAEYKDPLFVASTIESFGQLAAAREQPVRALRLGGAGTALKERIGSRDVFASGKRRREGEWARMRALLPQAAAEAAWEAGKRMTPEEAISEALAE